MGRWEISQYPYRAIGYLKPSAVTLQRQSDDYFQPRKVHFAQQPKKSGLWQAWETFWKPQPVDLQRRAFSRSLFLVPLALQGVVKAAVAQPLHMQQQSAHIRIEADQIRASVQVGPNQISSVLKLPFPVPLQERTFTVQDLNGSTEAMPLIQVLSPIERFPFLGQERQFFRHFIRSADIQGNVLKLKIPGLIAKDALIRIHEGVLNTQNNKPIPWQDVNTPAALEENSQGFVSLASAQVAFERPYLPFLPTDPGFINIDRFEPRAYGEASEGKMPTSRPMDIYILNQAKSLIRLKKFLQDDQDRYFKFLEESAQYSEDVNIRAAFTALAGTPFFDPIVQEIQARYQSIDFKPLLSGQLSVLEKDPVSGKARLYLNQDFQNEHFAYLAALLVQELVKYSQADSADEGLLSREKGLVAEAFGTLAYGSELLRQVDLELNLDLPFQTTPLAKRLNTRLYALIQSGGYYPKTLDLGFPNPGLQQAPHLTNTPLSASIFPYPEPEKQAQYPSWQAYVEASPEVQSLPSEPNEKSPTPVSPLLQALAQLLLKPPTSLQGMTFKDILKRIDQAQTAINGQGALYLVSALRLFPANAFYPRVSLG